MDRAAVVPDDNDDLMTAVMSRLHPNSDPHDAPNCGRPERWGGRLSPLLPPYFILSEIATDDHARIARSGGAKLNVTIAKGWWRRRHQIVRPQTSSRGGSRVATPSFCPGCCAPPAFPVGACLDEVELIGRYSPLQRGRSYAELARWLGSGPTLQYRVSSPSPRSPTIFRISSTASAMVN
jgi:hypothetical protein